jgi:hypothetical protein
MPNMEPQTCLEETPRLDRRHMFGRGCFRRRSSLGVSSRHVWGSVFGIKHTLCFFLVYCYNLFTTNLNKIKT